MENRLPIDYDRDGEHPWRLGAGAWLAFRRGLGCELGPAAADRPKEPSDAPPRRNRVVRRRLQDRGVRAGGTCPGPVARLLMKAQCDLLAGLYVDGAPVVALTEPEVVRAARHDDQQDRYHRHAEDRGAGYDPDPKAASRGHLRTRILARLRRQGKARPVFARVR